MFQRQTRQPFPARNIIVLAAAALLFLLYIVNDLKKKPQQQPLLIEQEEKKAKTDSLRPDEWWHLVREYPYFRPEPAEYARAFQAVTQNVQQRSGYPGFNTAWTVQGPGNLGGRINTIKVHPNNPNIIFIGYAGGGLWRSKDGGNTWTPIFDEQPFIGISDIEIDPKNPNIMYVGTGDHNTGTNMSPGLGLYKSSDGGETWVQSGLQNQRIVSKVLLDPSNSNILYAATMGDMFQLNNDRGLYKSTDGGLTWKQVLFVSNQAGVTDVEMAPNNPNVLYASSWERMRSAQFGFAHGQNSRVWKSTDGGQNWQKLNQNGLPGGSLSRIGLDVSAANPNMVIAIVVDSTFNAKGPYRSLDGGQKWSPTTNLSLPLEINNSFGWYFGKIFVNPFNINDLFICGVELWRSQDGGASWAQATPDWQTYEVHADMHDMAFINAQTFLLASDGGLYKTTDAGKNWIKLENNACSQLYRVAHNPHEPNEYYGGMQDNGTSGGNQSTINDWPRIFGGDGFQAQFHPTDPNIFYVETQNGSIWSIVDGLSEKTLGIPDSDRRPWDMPYFISTHNPEKMYTGTYRVYRSDAHPAFWTEFSTDLTDGVIFGPRYHLISAIHESPLLEDLLYVGTTDANVWRMDPDFTWTNISQGLPERHVSSVRASPTLTNRVYVTLSGFRAGSNSSHIYRSEDKGKTWTSISGDLPDMPVNDLFVLPGKRDSVLFAATEFGIFGSMNGGKHWERLGKGMPFVATYDLEHNPAKRTLVAGTYGRSIMSFPLDSLRYDGSISTQSPVDAPAFTLRPSLARHFVEMVVNQPLAMPAEISVFSMSGKLMFQKRINDGLINERLDVSNYPVGAYIAVLKQGTKGMLQQKFVVQPY